MKSNKGIIIFFILSIIMLTIQPAYAVTLTVGNGIGTTGNTIQIPITVDNPSGIAGAVFTVSYDSDNLELGSIESSFFDTFSNQWADLNDPPDPYPPDSVHVGSADYYQPLINSLAGAGMMIAAARCSAETDPLKTTLFTLSFSLKSQGSSGTYPISIVSTTLSNVDAGYNSQGETSPILMGSDVTKEVTDPDAYIVLVDPSAQSPVGSVVPGSITFIFYSDNDGMYDEWEIENFGDLSHDGDYDGDFDGLTDLQEYQNGTNPNDSDTDHDGFTDLQEYLKGTDPTDPDSHPPRAMPWLLLLLGDD